MPGPIFVSYYATKIGKKHPYHPIDWNDRERFTYMGGMIRGIALKLGYPIRWGGDWDSDGDLKDNSFDDLVHIELTD